MTTFRSAVKAASFLWFPLIGSVAAWAVHLVALAALARTACTQPDHRWWLHAITAGCLVVAAASAFLACRLASERFSRADGADAHSRQAFLGQLAIGVCSFNVVLIAAEELLVIALRGVSCG